MRGVHIFEWCACVSGLLVSSPKDGWPGFASACNSSLSNVPNGSHTCLVLASSVRVGRIGQDRHAGACCNCFANAFSAQARGHSPTLRRGLFLAYSNAVRPVPLAAETPLSMTCVDVSLVLVGRAATITTVRKERSKRREGRTAEAGITGVSSWLWLGHRLLTGHLGPPTHES
jgi:hypothetical protein